MCGPEPMSYNSTVCVSSVETRLPFCKVSQTSGRGLRMSVSGLKVKFRASATRVKTERRAGVVLTVAPPALQGRPRGRGGVEGEVARRGDAREEGAQGGRRDDRRALRDVGAHAARVVVVMVR